jgi:hypothetical protein
MNRTKPTTFFDTKQNISCAHALTEVLSSFWLLYTRQDLVHKDVNLNELAKERVQAFVIAYELLNSTTRNFLTGYQIIISIIVQRIVILCSNVL